MRRVFILSLVLLCVPACYAQSCPVGYSTNDNKTCYRVYSDLDTRNIAAAKCAIDGGYLASVPNGFANSYISSLAANAGAFVWLGIQCASTDKNSCVNDDGTTFGPYSNFAPGNPSTFGTCVYMSQKSPTNLQWLSFDCSASFSYVCEYSLGPRSVTTTTKPPTRAPINNGCPKGYSYFQGMCYLYVDETAVNNNITPNQASAECRKIPGGNLATINNAEVNHFVSSLEVGNSDHWTAFGLRCLDIKSDGDKGSCKWDDGTLFNYNAFKSNHPVEGGLLTLNGPGCCDFNHGRWDNCHQCTSYFNAYICQAPPQ